MVEQATHNLTQHNSTLLARMDMESGMLAYHFFSYWSLLIVDTILPMLLFDALRFSSIFSFFLSLGICCIFGVPSWRLLIVFS